MSLNHRLRKLALCLTLLAGALGGMPMRPEEIEDLMHTMNEQKIMMTVEDEGDHDELPKLPNFDS